MDYTKEQILEALKEHDGKDTPEVLYEAVRQAKFTAAADYLLSRFPALEAIETACGAGVVMGWAARDALAKAEKEAE